VDVLDWSGNTHRAVSITADAELSQRHVEDCAIQAWAIRGLELPEHRYIVGLSRTDENAGDEFEALFRLSDVTEETLSELERIDSAVADARRLHAALDEPAAKTGPQCHKAGYACPFLDYCDQG
jgi:hypothetical protein